MPTRYSPKLVKEPKYEDVINYHVRNRQLIGRTVIIWFFFNLLKPIGNRTTCCSIKIPHSANICTFCTRLPDWVLSIYPRILPFLCPYNCCRLFRRLCIVAKSACYCRRVRPAVCPHVPTRIQMERFPWNLILGTFMVICRGDPNLVTIGQKCLALYMKNYVCFVVPGDISSP